MRNSTVSSVKKGIEPVHIISALLSSTIEVLLIVALIYIIQTPIVHEEEREPIKMDIVLAQNTVFNEKTQDVTEDITEEKIEKAETVKAFDPIFEAMSTFEKVEKQQIEGVTSGYEIVERGINDELEVPETLIPLGDISFNDVSRSVGMKKMKRVSTYQNGTAGDRVSFSSLKQYFPNFSTVQEGMGRDYNSLLSKTSKVNDRNLQGLVLVDMKLMEDGNVDVKIISAPSPELSNLVLKNLKLLRTGQRLEALSFTVEINFVGSKS